MTTETLLDSGTTTTTPAATTTTTGTEGQTATTTTEGQTGATKVDEPVLDAEGKPVVAPKADEGAPEKYEDFKPIEGVKAPAAELMTEFSALAKELGMSQAKAQDAFALVAKLAEKGAAGTAAREAAAVEAARATQSAAWTSASQTDKEFGGEKLAENLAVAKAAMNATTTPELRKLLNDTGLGNNPEVIRHFLKIAPAFKESKHVTGGQPAKTMDDAAKSFYPSMTSK